VFADLDAAHVVESALVIDEHVGADPEQHGWARLPVHVIGLSFDRRSTTTAVGKHADESG